MANANQPTDSRIREEVLRKYKKGIGPKALAEEFGISINTIKSWIAREKSAHKSSKKNAPSKPKKNAPSDAPKKAGAPLGNHNALWNRGNIHASGQPGNTNAVKHGAYRYINPDLLDPGEKEMYDSVSGRGKEAALSAMDEQVKLLTIRENRIMKAINRYRLMETQDEVEQVRKSEGKVLVVEETGEQIDRPEMVTISENKDNIITRLERELTSVTKAKTKLLEDLLKNDYDQAREDREVELHPLRKELLDAQIESVDANTQKVLGENIEIEDLTAADELIYGGVANESTTQDSQNAEP